MGNERADYPRVLVITGDALGAPTGTGLTLANLFHGWPLDRISQIHCDAAPPSPEICSEARRLSAADVPVDRLVRGLLGKRKERILGRAPPGLPSGVGRATSWLGVVHDVASAWADCFSMRLPSSYWAWVEANRPEVIYSMPGSIRLMSLVLYVSRRLSLPVVPHFMDDWPVTRYRTSFLCAPPRWKMVSRLGAVIRRSPLGMTISEAMAEEYQGRYGIRFEAFMNCVEVPGDCPTVASRDDAPVRFAYVGNLHLNRWRALLDVGTALNALQREGIRAELLVYAPAADIEQHRQSLSAVPGIRIAGSLSAADIPAALRAADVLVHVESFDPAVSKYTRLSLSTKLPQYMAAGRPILAYGPATLASCRYVAGSRCGVVVGSEERDALLAAARGLAAQPLQRADLGRCGWQAAANRHSATAAREAFRTALAEAAAVGLPSSGRTVAPGDSEADEVIQCPEAAPIAVGGTSAGRGGTI